MYTGVLPYFNNGENVTIYYPDHNNVDPLNVKTASLIRTILNRNYIENTTVTFQKLFADDLDEAVCVKEINFKSFCSISFGTNVGKFQNGYGLICAGVKGITTKTWEILRHNDNTGHIKTWRRKQLVDYTIKLTHADQDMAIWNNHTLIDPEGNEISMQEIQQRLLDILQRVLKFVKSKYPSTPNFKPNFVTPKILVTDEFPITLYCGQTSQQTYLKNMFEQCNIPNVTLPTNAMVYGFKLWESFEECKQSLWSDVKYIYYIHLLNLNYIYVSNRDDPRIPLIKASEYIVGVYKRPLYYADRTILQEEIKKCCLI